MGKKSDDRWVVPLCRDCHNGVHLVGTKEEPEWFLDHGVDAEELASELWENRDNIEDMKTVLLRYT